MGRYKWCDSLRRTMKSFVLFTFLAVCLLSPPAARAQNRVVYSESVTTTFKWQWPLQTVRSATYTQTKPYYSTRRMIYLTKENVSRYRFYYPQKASQNDWGYFFKPGDKLYSPPAVRFSRVKPADRTGQYLSLK